VTGRGPLRPVHNVAPCWECNGTGLIESFDQAAKWCRRTERWVVFDKRCSACGCDWAAHDAPNEVP